jgi:hypothetical protein
VFRRRPDGTLAVALGDEERAFLVGLTNELSELLTAGDADDPVAARLFPAAYLDPTEEEAEAQWRSFVHPDLLRDRLAALESVGARLRGVEGSPGRGEVVLDEDEQGQLLGVLNDARLALGVRLGVTEDLDLADIPPSDPTYHAHQVYAWLTYLQGELVDELLGGLG